MSTYGKPKLGGKWSNIPDLLDPHCDKSASLKQTELELKEAEIGIDLNGSTGN